VVDELAQDDGAPAALHEGPDGAHMG
jgi:hypothetical protein